MSPPLKVYQYKTKRWIDVLVQFTKNYNQTPHRSIGMAPSGVSDKNREKVFLTECIS